MELLDRNNLDILNHIAQTISSVQNPVELFQKSKRLLKILIPCDFLLYFIYEPDQDLFTAPYALNEEERQITNQDAIFYDILNSRHARVRNENKVPVYPGVKCELYAPIYDHFRVFGCLYFGRTRNNYFSYADIRLAEHVSILYRLPVDRLQKAFLEENWGEKAEYWQRMYHDLIDAIPYPAVIIGDDIQVNREFLNISGYSREEFSLKTLDQIWTDAHIVKENPSALYPTHINHANGTRITTQALVRSIAEQSNQYLVTFVPQKNGSSLAANILKLKLYDREEADFDTLFPYFADLLRAKYIVYVDFGENKAVHAYTSQGSVAHEKLEPLSKGPFEAVLKKRKTMFIPDVHNNSFFSPWTRAALKANYRSLVMLPIFSEKKAHGLINIYWQNEQNWTEGDKKEFTLLRNYFTLYIFANMNLSRADNLLAKMNCLLGIQKIFNRETDWQTLVRLTVEKLSDVIPFDYFSLSLIDPEDHSTTCYDFALERFHKQYQDKINWQAVPGSSFGNVRSLKQSSERFPFSLPAKTSILLMHQETYLGNIALGRIDDIPFKKNQVRFLRQLAMLFSLAVQQSRRQEQSSAAPKNQVKTLDEDFIFSVIHDLKSPLQSLKSFHALLYERTESDLCDEEKYYYERIVANLDNIENIINDILVLFRIGHEKEDVGDCDLNLIVDNVVESMEGALEKQNIRVEKEELPVIRYSQSGITHIFQNLISNAVKAVINRSLPLISIQNKETPDHISVHVRDNGVGIDENEMDFIFRPFYTKSVDGLPSGSGFGLTITKKILDLHGGHIDVTSAPDKGTTFILSFPKEIVKSV